MQSVELHRLTANPSEALRKSQNGPVVVVEGDHVEAVLMHLDPTTQSGERNELTLVLAVALYKDGALSLGRAARVASVTVSDMATHLSHLGIPVAGEDPREASAQDSGLGISAGAF